VGSVSPTYDGNGNLTFDGAITYGYDAESRLVSASGTGLTASYAYDARGWRKSKTVNGATTIYVADPAHREILDYDGGSGAIQHWNAFGPGANEVLNAMNVAAATRTTFIPDIQGSLIATLDSGSGAVSKAGFLAFGESAAATGSFRYTGQRIDPETNGLYYYRARMYSPALGRFLQADPIGTAGGANFYAYAANDPLNLVDPYGVTPDQPGQAASGNAGSLITASSRTDLDQLSTQLTAAYSVGDQGAISQILAQIENLAGAVSGGGPPPLPPAAERAMPYAGMRAASQYLIDAGVPRLERVQILQSFEAETVNLRAAGLSEYGLRYFDDENAQALGRYLFETFPASRESLALSPRWNQMTRFTQWQIRPGAILVEGRASAQGIGLPGGQIQKFVPNLMDLLKP
jgi:RHS repeat-associated protein